MKHIKFSPDVEDDNGLTEELINVAMVDNNEGVSISTHGPKKEATMGWKYADQTSKAFPQDIHRLRTAPVDRPSRHGLSRQRTKATSTARLRPAPLASVFALAAGSSNADTRGLS